LEKYIGNIQVEKNILFEFGISSHCHKKQITVHVMENQGNSKKDTVFFLLMNFISTVIKSVYRNGYYTSKLRKTVCFNYGIASMLLARNNSQVLFMLWKFQETP